MLLASVCETPPMRVRRRPSLTRYMPVR